jgi:hypothetical protein
VRAWLLDGALHPFHLGEIDAEIVLQMAADHHGRGLRIQPYADAFAFHIFRRADARVAIDEDEPVTKSPRRKNRQRDETVVAGIDHAHVFGDRQLGAIEIPTANEPVENLARCFDGDVIERDSLGLDFAGAQRLGAIVSPAGEGQRQFMHGVSRMSRS